VPRCGCNECSPSNIVCSGPSFKNPYNSISAFPSILREKGSKSNGIEDNLFSVISWNSRSFNSFYKLKNIVQFDPDVACIQECWRPKRDILDSISNDFRINTRGSCQGEGTLTWWKPSIIVTKEVFIGDSTLLRCNIASEITFWIANCYMKKKNKLEMLNLFNMIQKGVPAPQWKYLIIMGDLNLDINSVKDGTTQALFAVLKQMGLYIQPTGPTRLDSTLDIVATGSAFLNVQVNLHPSPSDHSIVHCSFNLAKAKVSEMKFHVPNKKAADRISLSALKTSENASSFLNNVHNHLAKRNFNIMKEIKIKANRNELMERILRIENEDDDVVQIIQDYWTDLSLGIETSRFSGESAEAFHLMKRIYKYHLIDRKDGSIVNKILLPSGDVLTSPKDVASTLIEELKNLQSTKNDSTYASYVPFPELPLLSKEECKEIISNISVNKAIAFDGISDLIFQKNNIDESSEKLCDLWNVNWNNVPDAGIFFRSRLIPLNKSHPKLPGPKDFRPIIVSSPIVKLLEARLLPKIRDYLQNHLYRGQIGFTPGLGTSVNLHRLVQKYAELSTKNERGYALFLDFKSAYNAVLIPNYSKGSRKCLMRMKLN